MVITVTINPAMDKTLIIDNFSIGEVNRVSSLRYDIGGKGINVSKVLKNFGVESICTGFLGGIWKDTFEKEFKNRAITHEFVTVQGDTRTNTKVVDLVNTSYTDINEQGPTISNEELQTFINKFENLCSSDDIVVLSGGVCPSIPVDIYATLTKIAKSKGAFVILDADGELFTHGLKAKPNVIKPNDVEFEKLFNRKFNSNDDLISAAKELIADGIDNILLSLGSKGALYITKEGSYFAKGLKVPVKSTVGAGDSMVSAIIYSLINNYDNENLLRFAVGCGSATVTLEGTEACTLEQVNQYLNQIEIVKL